MPPTPPPIPSARSSKSSVSKSQKRVKTYLTIDDLHRMFAEKSRRAYLLIIQKIIFSPSSSSQFMSHRHLKSVFKFIIKSTTQMRTSSTQMRITFIFKSAREKTEKMISLSRKSGLISRSSSRPCYREVMATRSFKCALNLNAQRYVSGLPLIDSKIASEKILSSSHTSLTSTFSCCRDDHI